MKTALLLALLLCITACNGDTPGESDTPAPESDTPDADSVTEAPTVSEVRAIPPPTRNTPISVTAASL